MNQHFLIFLTYLFAPILTCIGQEIDKVRGLSWISVDYIKQIENYLPCECANSENYVYYISIASKNIEKVDEYGVRIPEIILNYIIQTDGARQFYIISKDSNKYVVADYYENWNSTLELILVNDTLLLIDNGKYRKFIKSGFSFEYHTDDIYLLDNIVLLNKSLTLRGYPPIQSILKEDSLRLGCNGWLGKINIIYSQKPNKSWVLEIKQGYLFIKKMRPHRDPADKIKTKVIKKIKWDNV